MWRRCDLHNHTTPNDQDDAAFDPAAFVAEAVAAGLDVVAVTDHDHIDHVEAVVTAAEQVDLTVVRGLEVTTDNGHVLVLAPGARGQDALTQLIARVGIRPESPVAYDELTDAVLARSMADGRRFCTELILVGAHADAKGSMLMPAQPAGLARQIERAEAMDALEVVNEETRHQWQTAGVKNSSLFRPLLRSSDHHKPGGRRDSHTWIYLPEVDVLGFRQAFATKDASIRFEGGMADPEHWIESVSIRGASHHDGLQFEFGPRTNVLIGAPSTGKSLIIDALRYLFSSVSEVDEIEKTRASRLAACLPAGAVVEAVVRTGTGSLVLERVVGGEATPELPFVPIIFSQNELVHRSMAASPHIALLDAHCPETTGSKNRLAELAGSLRDGFAAGVELARKLARAESVLTNAVDGLDATRERVSDLAGNEGFAQGANSLARIARWRADARTAIGGWIAHAGPPGVAGLPPIPTLTEMELQNLSDPDGLALELASDALLPATSIASRFDDLGDEIRRLVSAAADEATEMLKTGEPELIRAQAAAAEAIGDGEVAAGAEHLAALEDARKRLADLEALNAERDELRRALAAKTEELDALVDEIESERDVLRAHRSTGCAQVNRSIKGFRVRLERDSETAKLSGCIDSIKTGTYLREETLARVRSRIDRRRVLRSCLALLAGHPLVADPSFADQDALIANAIDRSAEDVLATIAGLFPGDGLIIETTDPGAPVPFTRLTEGLRALAIKEISFASGDLPVVSDQPEDAVPTQSVYDTLVPTLRQQRGSRQFILVSHDANIAVGGDADRVLVLGVGEDGAIDGCLFEEDIKRASLDLLEGGAAAFQQRQERYGVLVV